MRINLSTPLFIALVSFALSIDSDAQVFTENDSGGPTYLYVLSATSGTMEGDALTMKGTPNVVYFSDRPSRIAGHMSVSDFVDLWNGSSDSFKADPPNATLSMMEGASVSNVVVELMDARVKDSSVTFKVRVLHGEPPKDFANSSLFIDNFGPFPGDPD